jgi:dihydroorotate dehydrogenase
MLPKFERQRQKYNKYYALTIDPACDLNEKDIKSIMDYVYTNTGEQNLEIKYVIHSKVSNGRNHIHAYVKTQQKQKLVSVINLFFSCPSYKLIPVYDLKGWVEYMTRTGAQIINLPKDLTGGGMSGIPS